MSFKVILPIPGWRRFVGADSADPSFEGDLGTYLAFLASDRVILTVRMGSLQ